MSDTLKHYEVLELEPGASAERVRNSYIELTRVWDPERYVDNPLLRSQAEKRRLEIDEAYQSLCTFLPELQEVDSEVPMADRPTRDFTELSVQPPTDPSRLLLGILAVVVFLLLFVWAVVLVGRSRDAVPVPVVQSLD